MNGALIVQRLQQAISGLQLVYLFGSQAGAGARADSDVDVAVLADEPLPPDQRWEIQECLASSLGRSVDLVDLARASAVFRAQVVGNGQVLFERDAAGRRAYEGRVLADYARLNEERKEILLRVGREGRIHA